MAEQQTERAVLRSSGRSSLKVLQITDTHLYADANRTLLGINTLDSFSSVIDHIRSLYREVDCVLATGDLVHDASPNGYRNLARMLSTFGVPVYCLPGNHDVPDVMRQYLKNDLVSCPRLVDAGNWQLVLLDSVLADSEGGELAATELELLRAAVRDNDKHTLVTLHHQPLPVGSAWIDTMTVSNGQALLELADSHDQIRGLLWGHVHQTYDVMRGNVRLMASPSTCVQFAPGIDAFQVDEEPPGYRFLELQPDGSIDSEVTRIPNIPAGLQTASSGY